MSAWSSWELTTQANIDECAEALMAAGWYNDVRRGRDDSDPPNPKRSIQIHDANDELKNYDAVLGQAVVLMGSTLLVLSAEDYAASPFSGGA
jgi:hypothetical protein